MIGMAALLLAGSAAAQTGAKARAAAGVEERAKLAQEINDSLFSFAELGFQPMDTARYLTAMLERGRTPQFSIAP